MFSSQKFLLDSREIRTKFVRISYEFRANFRMPQYSHKLIHMKFVQILFEFQVNFTTTPRNLVTWGMAMYDGDGMGQMPTPFHRLST